MSIVGWDEEVHLFPSRHREGEGAIRGRGGGLIFTIAMIEYDWHSGKRTKVAVNIVRIENH